MRKTGKRSVNYGMRPQPPMLVSRGIRETGLELKERMAVDAFAHGAATQEHFFLLQDVLNLLLIAGQSSPARKYAMDKAEQDYKPVLLAIQARHGRTGKFGMTGQELLAMRHMISFSRSFWMRQPTELFAVCHAEASAFYREQQEGRERWR